jgi:c-di-GMP-binding flagellar brake protein YcgR
MPVDPPAATSYETMRRYPRVKSDIRVRVFVPPKDPTSDSFGRGYDISESGMALYVPLELAVGQQVLVVLEVPQCRIRLALPATVRNGNGYRYGVEFVALSNTERKELKRALARLAVMTTPAA